MKRRLTIDILVYVFTWCVPVITVGDDHSANITCTVKAVAWTPNEGGTVQIRCGDQWYYAYGTHSLLPTSPIETREAWYSLAQSALLSGRPLYLEFRRNLPGDPLLFPLAITYVRLSGA